MTVCSENSSALPSTRPPPPLAVSSWTLKRGPCASSLLFSSVEKRREQRLLGRWGGRCNGQWRRHWPVAAPPAAGAAPHLLSLRAIPPIQPCRHAIAPTAAQRRVCARDGGVFCWATLLLWLLPAGSMSVSARPLRPRSRARLLEGFASSFGLQICLAATAFATKTLHHVADATAPSWDPSLHLPMIRRMAHGCLSRSGASTSASFPCARCASLIGAQIVNVHTS